MNIYMVLLPADGRGAASDTKRRSEESRAALSLRVPAGQAPAPKPAESEKTRANELVVDRAIRGMSIAACVDGGLFAVLLMSDLSVLLGGFLGSRRISKRRTERDVRSRELEAARRARAVLDPEWKRREAQSLETAAEFVLACRGRLQRKLADLERQEEEQRRVREKLPERSLDQLIQATLRYELKRRAVETA